MMYSNLKTSLRFPCLSLSSIIDSVKSCVLFVSGAKDPLFKSAVPEFSRHILIEPVIYKNNDRLVSTFTQVSNCHDCFSK